MSLRTQLGREASLLHWICNALLPNKEGGWTKLSHKATETSTLSWIQFGCRYSVIANYFLSVIADDFSLFSRCWRFFRYSIIPNDFRYSVISNDFLTVHIMWIGSFAIFWWKKKKKKLCLTTMVFSYYVSFSWYNC